MTRKLPADVADRLLDRLSEDDDFRELFRRDPRAALAALGHADAADPSIQEGAWSCLHGEGLPDKQAIRNTRSALRAQMTSQVGMDFIVFKAAAG